MTANIYVERIGRLREVMARNGWDAVVIHGSDPHGSEYPAQRWQQVKWLSGFTGEAADMVVTRTHAGLWTDSRYFIQALSQLEGTGVELHKTRVPGAVGIPQWLSECAETVAVDGLCVSVGSAQEIEQSVKNVVSVPDILSELWCDRPGIPESAVTTLDLAESGVSDRKRKMLWLRGWMADNHVDHVLLTSLDEIAWLLNIRGNDIEYNPLVISYLIVGKDQVSWFVRKGGELSHQTIESFEEVAGDGIEVRDYSSVFETLAQLGSSRLFIDPSTLNYYTYGIIRDVFPDSSLVVGTSPVILKKAVKEDSEIERLRQTFIWDGVAMEKFLYWLHTQISQGSQVTEWDASAKLTSLRAELPGYRGNSFENISAYGPNAALPHYVTPCEGSGALRSAGLYLVDSGGQYTTGTTDITRTVPLGPCSRLEKEDYTLVLKGMIDLSMAVFPEGTAGCQIDALARMPLWKAKRNFGHGTGHGVGYYLCVHEGPQSIRYQYNPQPLLPGMVTSNEPAIYREGMHGIRHENIVLCRQAGESEFGKWLDFETLTYCHIDTSAVLPELLGPQALQWLNAYNAKVYRTLAPLLPEDVSIWLEKQCAELK